jgi:hypothetical protein
MEGGVEKYRILRVNEIVRYGDEFRSSSKEWYKSYSSIGLKVFCCIGGSIEEFRRPITGNKSNAAQRCSHARKLNKGRA